MKKLLLLMGTMMVIYPSFDTLEQARSFADSLPENPSHTNVNHLDPNYSSFYKKYSKSSVRNFFETILSYVGIKPADSVWPIEQFATLMNTLVDRAKKNKQEGFYIEKIVPKPGARIIIWGDVQGAFHSLIRDLFELKRLGIINDEFKLSTSDCYLVFNGDLINRSAYSLETLTLVMMLMDKNPEHVFYVKGNHETNKNWHDYGFKRELQFKAERFGAEKIPYDTLVQQFFNTLPMALFFEGKDKNSEKPAFLRISHYEVSQEPLLDEDNFVQFLLQNHNENRSIHFPQQLNNQSKLHVDVKAAIQGVSRSTTFRPTDGLDLLVASRGATAWTTLSSPTETYGELYKFYNDAFTIITVHEFINNWTITLYAQDVRKKNGFSQKSYHLLSGRPLKSADEILDLQEIVIGSINDVTKSTGALGKSLREGLGLRINQANKTGELGDKYIRIIFLDDEYTPSKTVQAMEKIKNRYGSDIILTTLGTPTQEALIPYIKDKKIAVLFGYSGAGIFRKPELTNTIHYRTAYEREGYSLVKYGVTELNVNRFAIFYQNDAYGKALRDGARMGLNEFKCSWVEGHYPRNTLKIEEAAKIIEDFDPEVILLFGTRAPSYALLQKLGITYVADKHIMGGSFLTDAFRDMINPRGLSLTITRVVPDPKGNVPIAKEYRESLYALNPDDVISVDSFEGYINASLFIEALKNITGPLTKEKLMEYFHTIKNLDFKGLKLNYDPNSQELSQDQDVWVDNGKKWTKISDQQWKYDPSQANEPQKKLEKEDKNDKTAFLYVPSKKNYTEAQLNHKILFGELSELIGTYNDQSKKFFLSSNAHLNRLDWQ